jgi:hypothetical protein
VVSEHSALSRQALASLLERAEQAAAEGDDARARSLLSDLHWFAHADGRLHQDVHRLELALARRRGDRAAAIAQLLPNLFARPISFLESLAPSYEVVEDIEAPPAWVYRTIADVESYAAWNPWVVSAKGTQGRAARVGDEVVASVKLGRRQIRVGHRVLVAEPDERFGWRDVGWFTPLAGGRRLRWIEPRDGGSRIICRIQLYGPLARLAWWLYGASIRDGMAAEASALAERALTYSRGETLARAPSPRRD